jgi:large subunit ribosomal protein L35
VDGKGLSFVEKGAIIMPKIKTKKAVKKRFRFTKKGKIKRSRAFKSHILTKKSRKRKRALRRGGIVSSSEARTIKRLMPYG